MRRWGERVLTGSGGNGWLILVATAALAGASLPAGQAVPVAGRTPGVDAESRGVELPVVQLLPAVDRSGTEPPVPDLTNQSASCACRTWSSALYWVGSG